MSSVVMFLFEGFLFVLLSVFCVLNDTNALPEKTKKNIAFVTPEKLQPRVNFWISIFTHYGEHHEVLHHRAYPQAVFKVLNFYAAASKLDSLSLEKLKKKEIKKHTELIREAVENLANGKNPVTDLEKIIAQELEFLGDGTEKYEELLADNMIRSQQGIKERFQEAIERSGRYLPHIESIFVNEFGLPIELTRLPFVESSFLYQAKSSVGAAGIWQFMPATARTYKLKVNSYVDERLDVIEASRAAASYLKDAYNVLESWPLAVTSYNHGVSGIAKKVKQLGTSDISEIVEHRTERLLGFASNNFYPELLAAITVYDSKDYYFPNLQISAPLSFQSYKLKNPTSVEFVKNNLHVSVHDLMSMNYALQPAVWSGRYRIPKGYNLKFPSKAAKYQANLKIKEPSSPATSSVYSGLTYKVRKGDTLISLARKFNVSVEQLKKNNNLKSSNLYVGQKLVIKKEQRNLINTRVQQTRSGNKREYIVKKGDTLSSIAKRNKISLKNLKLLNGLNSSNIKIGQRLILSGSALKRKHLIKKGDTLWSIAQRYGTSITALKKENKIKGNNLTVGKKIIIP